ncbi:hypothetical protein BV25DRAFT_1830849 [Artomyces pyxidatus]|uniref:Uncharacterized protein n=1 Tax=Artomyces pyxidatus TaxID=48021 RepID=A0ACB8SPR8_9AGAM|nr:hypothetical protein BV25DRAFT_1830849 [Artomyces pyxidatus]
MAEDESQKRQISPLRRRAGPGASSSGFTALMNDDDADTSAASALVNLRSHSSPLSQETDELEVRGASPSTTPTPHSPQDGKADGLVERDTPCQRCAKRSQRCIGSPKDGSACARCRSGRVSCSHAKKRTKGPTPEPPKGRTKAPLPEPAKKSAPAVSPDLPAVPSTKRKAQGANLLQKMAASNASKDASSPKASAPKTPAAAAAKAPTASTSKTPAASISSSAPKTTAASAPKITAASTSKSPVISTWKPPFTAPAPAFSFIPPKDLRRPAPTVDLSKKLKPPAPPISPDTTSKKRKPEPAKASVETFRKRPRVEESVPETPPPESEEDRPLQAARAPPSRKDTDMSEKTIAPSTESSLSRAPSGSGKGRSPAVTVGKAKESGDTVRKTEKAADAAPPGSHFSPDEKAVILKRLLALEEQARSMIGDISALKTYFQA